MSDDTVTDGLHDLLASMRPRLHAYCARMVGSAFDGEDVVQDAMAKAASAWPGDGGIEQPESWLFRIAHNTALDELRRRRRQPVAEPEVAFDALPDVDAAADARVAATASLAAFLPLPPVQRSSVILADVLGHSLAETGDYLDLTLPAVKAALHRGRAALRRASLEDAPVAALGPAEHARLRAYADHFNARDFDALRDLLAEDVRLDLANRLKLSGREKGSLYFTRYAETANWHFVPGLAEGAPALLVTGPDDPAGAVRYVVLLGWEAGRITTIRDFLFAPYVMASLRVTPMP